MGEDRQSLAEGLSELKLDLPAEIQSRLLEFRDLLVRWNRVYNLTSVRDPEEMIARHLLDSLSVLPHLIGSRCLDVGTGAGLPGIPLALAAPDRYFTLLDSQAKRTRFLRQAVVELSIENVEIAQSRVEDFRPEILYDTVLARAFAKTSEFIRLAGPHCAIAGQLLAMKGALDEDEIAQVEAPWQAIDVQRLQVPGLPGERHLVRIQRSVD